jgi:L-lactate dehydrogenase (cytochrome)
MSICSIEDIAANTSKPFWFQLYVMKDRDFINRLIDRAKAALLGAGADAGPVLGQRHKDLRNGLSAPPKLTIANLINLATKPRWCLGMLGTKRRSFGNIVGHAKSVSDMSSLSSWTSQQFDLACLERRGVDQAALGRQADHQGHHGCRRRAPGVESGADALIVSNHGGRQLDGAESSIALPRIVDAVGKQIEVHMDGGIRSGQDVIKAWRWAPRASTSAVRSCTAWARWASRA